MKNFLKKWISPIIILVTLAVVLIVGMVTGALPDAVNAVIKKLTDKEVGVVSSLSEINAVGHRLVHGGEKFSAPVRIDDKVAVVVCVDYAVK